MFYVYLFVSVFMLSYDLILYNIVLIASQRSRSTFYDNLCMLEQVGEAHRYILVEIILRVSICSLRLPKIYVLKLSSKLPISTLLTVPIVDLLILDIMESLGFFPDLTFPLEMCIHNSQISPNDN